MVRGRRRVWGGVVAWNFFHAFCPPVQGSKEGGRGGLGRGERTRGGGVVHGTGFLILGREFSSPEEGVCSLGEGLSSLGGGGFLVLGGGDFLVLGRGAS